MKKSISSLVLVIVMIVVFSMPVYAANPDKDSDKFEILFQKEEIKDPATLYQRAKEGISDPVDESVLQKVKTQNKARMVNAETGLYDELDRFVTAQKLKVYKDKSDGTIYTDYALTSITVTPSSVSTNQDSTNGWDSHIAVQAFSTIYYTSEVIPYGLGTATAVLLTKVAWRFERDDSTVAMPTALYRYGCNGVPAPSGGVYTSSQVTENNYTPVNGQTETIVQNKGWTAILGNSQYYPSMGLYLDLTLTRGTSTWHLILPNNFAL